MRNSLNYIAVSALIFSAPLSLAETRTHTANVTVQNAITITPGNRLNFGTVFAKADTSGTSVATLTLPSNGNNSSVTASTPSTANLVEITAGSPATFTVSGVAPNVNLTLNLPTSPITLTGSNTATFTVDSFEATVTTGATPAAYSSGSPNLATDATGNATFAVGATLSTTNIATYLDETYSGTFSVEVIY